MPEKLSLSFRDFRMDHSPQKRQRIIENPAKLILNPHLQMEAMFGQFSQSFLPFAAMSKSISS
jgi:hypothetical protein